MRHGHALARMAACAIAVFAWSAQPEAARAAGSVTCQSTNHHYTFCPMDTRGGVALATQLSRGSGRCIAGRSWGWDARGVWVNDGCRAVFTSAAAGYRDGGYRDGGHRHGGRRDERRDPPRAEHGHRGPPGFWPGGGMLGQMGGRDRGGVTVDCASQGYRRAECPVDTSGGVVLVQQFSSGSGACVEGSSWGWTRYGIWVDDGCRARFRIWPHRQAGRGRR
ncbi:MAG: DUF3011 domain-containing protein [Sneathiellaceae bacterium]